ncbi:MAG: flippase-like domain-containing protein [Sandaracinaceae bacterium]|nr:flippase-like domain-containing protein [Sandaracinaceae bacterium]MBP7680567.1 flippase-like domain-containing protein [Deltaproteobacteria bacterium]MBK6808668.1 flippase-like domain-containing protein [Sandaracinaceae bacterium]MBK7150240.1 flippase-like domain-containing protein [Sandaracinaceae bacterium]MBK7774307.1 flippase-like domain-containing protein [Sandaracinaceae bacterium]
MLTEPLAAPAAPPPGLARRILPKLVVSLILGGLLAWLTVRSGVAIVPTDSAAWANVAPWAIPAYALSLLLTHFLRAARFRFLIAPIKPLPLREVVLINWIGFFAIFALPLRLGEFARPALTKLRHGVSVSAGIGTVAVERVLDGLMTSFCVAWALFVLPRRVVDDPLARALPGYGLAALALFTCAFLALGVFLWKRAWAVRTTERVIGIVSKGLAGFLATKVGGVADGLKTLADPRLAFGFVLETSLYWASNAFGMWLLAQGCGLELSFGQAVGVMGILAIGILLPAGPGLFGSFQLAVTLALQLFFASEIVSGAGAIYVFLLFVIQAIGIVLAGVIPLLAMRLRLADLMPRLDGLTSEGAG